MELNELVATYRQNGFVIAKKAFDLGPLDSFIDEINQIIFQFDPTEVNNKESKTSLDIYYEADGKTVKKCERILYNNPSLKAFVEHTEVLKRFLGEIFGEGFTLFKDKLNPKYAGEGSGWKLHVDGVFFSDTASRGWWDYASHFVNILIPLNKTSLENGALQIRPLDWDRCDYEQLLEMTDKDLNGGVPKQEYYEEFAKELVPLLLDKGDIAFFDPRCYHMSSANRSSEDRTILYLTYNKVSDGDNYLKYFEDKVKSSHLGDHISGDWQKLRDE